MTSWIRYTATLPIVAALLGLAVVQAARSVWSADPLRPAGMLVAPDQFTRFDKSRHIQATLVPLQPRLVPARRTVYTRLPDGRCFVRLTTEGGVCHEWVPPGDVSGVRYVKFRLSQESGYGPLRTFGRVFVIDRDAPAVVVDLEGVRRFGRYDLGPERLKWLLDRLARRQPFYVADVEPTGYNRLLSQLTASRWPDGPLLMWRVGSRGRPVTPDRTARNLLDRTRVELAVLADIPDNQAAGAFIRRRLPLAYWPKQ